LPLVLGIDSSTQSTKVELRDAETGELVGSGRAPHPATSPPRSEQDPAAWSEALVEAYPRRQTEGSQDAYHGPLKLYLDAGFAEVGEGERWVIVRKELT